MGNMTGPLIRCTEIMLACRTSRPNSKTTPWVVLARIIHNHWRISSLNYHVLPSMMITRRCQSLLLWGIIVCNEPPNIWDLATYCHRWWSQGDVSHSPTEESSFIMKYRIFRTGLENSLFHRIFYCYILPSMMITRRCQSLLLWGIIMCKEVSNIWH